MAGSDQRQRHLGAFYTTGNPFTVPAFDQWFANVPRTAPILEPFAGRRDLCRHLRAIGHRVRWRLFDIDESIRGVTHQDTLAQFPRGYEVAITNPPYLSWHFAKRKRVTIDRSVFGPYASLYQVAIAQALEHCSYVAMIIPESFLTTGLFQDRLSSVTSLNAPMFADTDMPTCLALWDPAPSEDFAVWRGDEHLGMFSHLARPLACPPCADRISFNVPGGPIGLRAIDSVAGPSISFVPAAEISPSRVTGASRLQTRIAISGLTSTEVAALIAAANSLLGNWRTETADVLLTAFKGLRQDGRFRRRLDYANARALLAQSLCMLQGHTHPLI